MSRRWGTISLLMVCLIVTLVPSLAPAQTTRQASVFDDQPIRRTPAANTAQAATPAPTFDFDWSRLVLAMGVVIGLILLMRFVVGKMYPGVGANKGARAVRVLSRSPIAPKQQVLLLQVGRRVIVVGDSAGTLTTLSEISDGDEVATLLGQLENTELPAIPSRFSTLFGKAQDEFIEDEPKPAADVTVAPVAEIEQAQTEISGLIDRMRSLTRAVRRE
jgi:flagellar protein FliO/FliZ